MRVHLRRQLEPFASAVRLITAYLIASLVVLGFSALTSDDVDMFGASDRICVEQTNISWSSSKGAKEHFADAVAPGVEALDDGVRFCRDDPTGGQTTLQVSTELPHALLVLAVFVLLWRLVGHARRHGPFSVTTAARLRMLGWLLLVGGLSAEAVEEIAEVALVRTMLRSGAWNQPHLQDFMFAGLSGISPSLLVTGLGLLTVARILRMGEMRNELIPTSSGLVVKGEDGLDGSGQAAG